jgi:hypothetical protein
MEDVSKIDQGEGVLADKTAIPTYDLRRHKKKKHFREAKGHLDELTKIVDEVHGELQAKDSPFRLSVYQEGEDVFIDIVTLDDYGRVSRVFKHDISHAELEDLVQHLKSGRGLLLDADV